MPQSPNILIHKFEPSAAPYFDDEGDQMLGYYYQFTDSDDEPLGSMIGPYSQRALVEEAAVRALNTKDF